MFSFLQTNSNYGKTLQNTRSYISVKLHVKSGSLLKSVSSPTFKNYSVIDEYLVQTNHFLPVIKHNTPIAIGVTILELSKAQMIDFWYNKITNLKNCSFDLAFSDTDSFCFKISNKNAFWKHIRPYMDYSNYDSDHPMFDNSCKAKLGYLKDELCGKYKCTELVGLRSKCYSMLLTEVESNKPSEKKVCKGIGRVAIKNRLKFEQYKSCLFDQKVVNHNFCSIRSSKHLIKTVKITKRALSFLDTKRYILNCGIHTLPFGSYLIKKYKGICQKC